VVVDTVREQNHKATSDCAPLHMSFFRSPNTPRVSVRVGVLQYSPKDKREQSDQEGPILLLCSFEQHGTR